MMGDIVWHRSNIVHGSVSLDIIEDLVSIHQSKGTCCQIRFVSIVILGDTSLANLAVCAQELMIFNWSSLIPRWAFATLYSFARVIPITAGSSVQRTTLTPALSNLERG